MAQLEVNIEHPERSARALLQGISGQELTLDQTIEMAKVFAMLAIVAELRALRELGRSRPWR